MKFRYNPEKLSYEMITTTAKERFIKWGIMFVASIVISVGYYLIYSHFYDTPKERAMINKLAAIKFNYQMLTQDLNHIDRILADIQKRDDNIYRTILESEPIPASIRQAGFGGINRYEPLEGYINSRLMIAATRQTDIISKRLCVQSISYDELIFKAKNKEQMAVSRPAIMPINSKKLKSPISRFGMRFHPKLAHTRMHTGLDFAADTGTDVYATGDGTVIKADYNSNGYGNMIIVDHGFGYQTLYAHLQKVGVLVGTEVKRGQKIGTVGSTGLSVGPHLHYEVHKNGRHVNPIDYFYNDLTPEEYAQLVEQAQNNNEIYEKW